jgi:hypothetical protein
MISLNVFNSIKRKHGSYASWAVWVPVGAKPKSNMADISVFDLDANPGLLALLKPNVLMVGLNFSRNERNLEPFGNFHDPYSGANDFKIRFAFKDTEYYGAYMTDVIKNHVMLDSKDVLKHLKDNPSVVKKHIDWFRRELRDLECHAPVILAFGADAWRLLHENLEKNEYSSLVKLTHYSHQIGKEKYRAEVLRQIADAS